MWYFLVIFNTKIIKSTKIIITIITHIIAIIIVTWFCNMHKNVVFDVQKKLYNLPELGGGGGRGNLGNARKKSIFVMGGVPLHPKREKQSLRALAFLDDVTGSKWKWNNSF